MVAEANEPEKRKHCPFNLQKREYHYTLPNGDTVIVSPHKRLVTLPNGTTVKVIKVEIERKETE